MVSVFIRTYEGDLDWFKYCLASLHRNLTGWDEIVICIPEGQEHKLRGLVTDEKVVTCPVYADDYIGQQISKLQAHRHVRGELVLFVDSDLVFHPGAQVANYLQADKPVILKESYARLVARHPELNLRKWQDVVKLVCGTKPTHEYMRRAPQLFLASTLRNLEAAFPGMEAHALRQPFRLFSEFNVLGYFAERNEPGRYVFIDLEKEALPASQATQHWSWGGITPAVFAELVGLGVADPSQPPDFSQLPPPPEVLKPLSRWRRFRHAIKRFFRGY